MKFKVVLASSSPRRRDLLAQFNIPFEIIKPEFDEIREKSETPLAYARRNAKQKGEWVHQYLEYQPQHKSVSETTLIISADTIVVLGDLVLEKPKDVSEARSMLQLISGRDHQVFTGVHLIFQHKTIGHKAVTFHTVTDVTIKKLGDFEIERYIATGEPFDKAGGYAAQGQGSYFIKEIRGSYANVVGLPICELTEILEEHFQISLWDLI